jgi:hypothetical protein
MFIAGKVPDNIFNIKSIEISADVVAIVVVEKLCIGSSLGADHFVQMMDNKVLLIAVILM